MASEPKKRHSKTRKRVRRASIKLEEANLIVCKNCSEKTLAHMICRSCGFYGEKQVTSKTDVKVTKA